MGQIALEGMEFFAYHGFSDEEQKIGNKYGIDVFLSTDISEAAESDSLRDTIDYGKVYNCVKLVMQSKHRLLEHVAHEIINSIKLKFSEISKIEVVVSKFNPPIGGVCTRAKITLQKTF